MTSPDSCENEQSNLRVLDSSERNANLSVTDQPVKRNLFGHMFCCLVGPEPCFFPCCHSCPKPRESLTTRICYALFLLLIAIASIILQVPSYYEEFQRLTIDEFDNGSGIIEKCLQHNTTICPGGMPYQYTLAYRFCYALFAFHIGLFLLTFFASNSKNVFGCIHNGFWFPKFIFLVAIIYGIFKVPLNRQLMEAAMYIGMIFGGLFIVFCQLLAILSFAHRLHRKWFKNSQKNKCWKLAIILVSIICIIIMCAMAYLVVDFYAIKLDCDVDGFPMKFIVIILIGSILIIILILVFLSISKFAQDRNENNSYLQALIIGVYVMYLTVSSVTSIPIISNSHNNTDNPLMADIKLPTSCAMLQRNDINSVAMSILNRMNQLMKWANYVGLALMTLMAIYSAMIFHLDRDIPTTIVLRKKIRKFCCRSEIHEEEVNIKAPVLPRIIRNDFYYQSYSYYLLHLTFASGVLYILMNLTMWYMPIIASQSGEPLQQTSIRNFGRNWPAVIVKLTSAILCLLIYFFTLFVPKIPAYDFTTVRKIKRGVSIEMV